MDRQSLTNIRLKAEQLKKITRKILLDQKGLDSHSPTSITLVFQNSMTSPTKQQLL